MKEREFEEFKKTPEYAAAIAWREEYERLHMVKNKAEEKMNDVCQSVGVRLGLFSMDSSDKGWSREFAHAVSTQFDGLQPNDKVGRGYYNEGPFWKVVSHIGWIFINREPEVIAALAEQNDAMKAVNEVYNRRWQVEKPLENFESDLRRARQRVVEEERKWNEYVAQREEAKAAKAALKDEESFEARQERMKACVKKANEYLRSGGADLPEGFTWLPKGKRQIVLE